MIYKQKLLLIILLPIIIIITFKKRKIVLPDLFEKISKNHPVINNYKFYISSDNPFMTLLLNFTNPEINYEYESFLHFISPLYEQTLINIQIIFIYNNLSSDFIKKPSMESIIKDKKLEYYNYQKKEWKNNFINLFEKIKGKFFIVFDKIIKFGQDDLFNLYRNAKGSITNIFKYNANNNKTYYLIRTKKFKNFIDSENDYENYQDIVNFIINQANSNINYIPIAYCPNNFYASLTYTSMISVLSTKMIYSYILFYLIINDDFTENNKKLINSLYEQFDYFNITFIKMDNRYEKAYTRRYLSKNAFYRLSLGELLPNLNKILKNISI